MPVISGADLTSVSTKNEPFPEGTYIFRILGSEMKDAKTLVIKQKCEGVGSDGDSAQIGREWWNFINLVQKDGKPNRVGAITIKRYMEAVFGEGSPEAENSNPDTDVLNNSLVAITLKVRGYTPEGSTEERFSNEAKLISPA